MGKAKDLAATLPAAQQKFGFVCRFFHRRFCSNLTRHAVVQAVAVIPLIDRADVGSLRISGCHGA